MPEVVRGRHIGYTQDVNVTPIVREMPSDMCADVGEQGDFYGARHITYTTPTLPPIAEVAVTLICCDNIEECPRVELACLPDNPDSFWEETGTSTSSITGDAGLDRSMKGHVFNQQNCNEVHQLEVDFEYCIPGGDPDDYCRPIPDCGVPPTTPTGCRDCTPTGTSTASSTGSDEEVNLGKWTSSISFSGGTLQLQICCFLDEHGDLLFRLIYTGCNQGCVEVFPDCIDPIRINFGSITVSECCSCTDSISPGEINLYVVTNCYLTTWARHIGYTITGIPIVATENNCEWSADIEPECTPRCGLVLSITDVTGDTGTGTGTSTSTSRSESCWCMEDTVDFPYISDGAGGNLPTWQNDDVGGCVAPATFRMTCTVNLDSEGNPDGTVTLHLDVICSVTNTGQANLIIPAEDLETLDVTFQVEMTDPTISDECGTCTFQWVDMPGNWVQLVDNCLEGCDCDPPTGSGTSMEIRVTDCVQTGAAVYCCLGLINVRVMR